MTTVLVGFILISFSSKEDKVEFNEIDVKRINLLSEDGELRMVLSNETRQHPGRLNGEDWSPETDLLASYSSIPKATNVAV